MRYYAFFENVIFWFCFFFLALIPYYGWWYRKFQYLYNQIKLCKL